MGPERWAMEVADRLKLEFPDITTDPYTLAYALMRYVEEVADKFDKEDDDTELIRN